MIKLFVGLVLVFLMSCKISKTSQSTTATSETPSGNSYKIFVTAAAFHGNFGTTTQADSLCLSDFNYPGTGNYKAMLVYEDGSRRACLTSNCGGGVAEHVDWVLKENTTYTRLDGTVIATTNSNGIFTFPLTNSFFGTATYVWTGIFTGWITQADNTCVNWTSTANMAPPAGYAGKTENKDSTALIFGNNCSQSNHLLCVQQ